MAQTILEFTDRHLIIRDADLIEVLEQMNAELVNIPQKQLTFLTEFIASDMLHVTGGVDPEFDVHLKTTEALDEFQTLINAVRDKTDGLDAERILRNLRKIEELVFNSYSSN